MVTGRPLTDESLLADLADHKTHPGDSSQFLLGLMAIAGKCQASQNNDNAVGLDGIICKDVLRSLLSTLHIRDIATVRHSRQVAMLSVGVAEYLGWEGKDLKMLEVASLLHDIGKIGVPDNILFKPGKLSPDEADLMAFHRNIAIDILQACRVNHNVLKIVEQSHGFFNGSTNRYEKIGSEMHQGARILAVADAYDSLRSEKAYRKGMRHEEILKLLQKESGTKFDGNIVSSLARWAERDGLAVIQNAGSNKNCLDSQKKIHPAEVIEASTLGRIFSYLYLLESLYDGFVLIDSDLRFVVWNYNISKLLGLPYSKMLGRTWTSRLLQLTDEHGNTLCDNDYPLKKVIENKEASNTVVQIQRMDNRWVKAEMHIVPLLDGENRLHGIAATFRDLSRISRRPREFHELKLAASRDSLTSVANRGELETQLASMLSDYANKKNAKPFSVIFMDVDFFKNINDSYGHSVGDQVLIDLAKLLQHETYSGELVGRYGGEEFVILCPDAELDQAFKRAERLRKAIPNACLGGSTDYHITSSFGVTQVETGDSIESILRRADKALYAAKEGGRNQSVTITTEDTQKGETDSNLDDERPENPYLFQSSFFACIAADLVIYKLGGFVHDQKSKLLEVEENRARVRLGIYHFFWPFWGETDDSQPVELLIEFGKEHELPQTRGRAASLQVEVRCEVQPLGKIRNPDIFEKRARKAIKLLRSYFAAD